MQTTRQMKLILKRLAMPEGGIEEGFCIDGYTKKYELSWRENGTRYGAKVTQRMVRELENLGLISVEYLHFKLALYTLATRIDDTTETEKDKTKC